MGGAQYLHSPFIFDFQSSVELRTPQSHPRLNHSMSAFSLGTFKKPGQLGQIIQRTSAAQHVLVKHTTHI